MITKKSIMVSITLLLLIILTGYGFITNNDTIPKGWFKGGTPAVSNNYKIGLDNSAAENVVYIKSLKENIEGFCTLMQNFSANKYLNERVMFSADIKSKNVDKSAGLWMRIDGKEKPVNMLEFDNMYNRPIKGTTDWRNYSVVLDVPSNSNMINIGILLSGTGEIFSRNLKFEIVNKTVPTTNMMTNPPINLKPINLELKK